MSMTATERANLVRLATDFMPASLVASGWNAIHFLAALYRAFGTHSAREVTDAIAQGTRSEFDGAFAEFTAWASGLTVNFSGFIEDTTTEGFKTELADPRLANAQTGHFFSYVVWALDGLNNLEFVTALGHELASDAWGAPVQLNAATEHQAGQEAGDFRRIVVSLPQDPNGTLSYANLDTQFADTGWNWAGRMSPYCWGLDSVTHEWSTHAYTGNSIQDLRCTVAGFHFGRLVRSGLFSSAAHAAQWLDRNVLDTSPYLPLPADVLTPAS